MRRDTTPGLDAQLDGIQYGMLPATRVTGPPRVTGTAPRIVDLTVPTDAGPADITMRQVRPGAPFRADSVSLTMEGD